MAEIHKIRMLTVQRIQKYNMETTLKSKEQKILDRDERRSRVFEGLEQITQGKTHNFDEVCNRLEKKYRNA